MVQEKKDTKVSLIRPAADGKTEEVERLLKQEVNFAATNKDKDTALHCAARNGHLKIVELLVNRVDIHAPNKFGRRALHVAAHHGHKDVVRQLLKNAPQLKEDLEAPDKDGWTALHCAAHFGDEAMVRVLRDEYDADIEAKDKDGWTPLHFAAAYGYKAVAEVLRGCGANIEAKTKTGRMALHFAASRGHKEVAQVLLQEPGETIEATEEDGWTPLIFAASRSQVAVVQLLLEAHARIDAIDKDGWTPLHFGAYNGQGDIVALLLKEGTSVLEATSKKKGWTPLLAAAYKGHDTVVSQLLERGANIEASETDTKSRAVHIACSGNRKAVAKLLEERGADFSIANKTRHTGFYLAARNGYTEIIRKLLKGNKISREIMRTKPNNWTPLFAAISGGYGETAILLLDHGADNRVTDEDGTTELHSAARHGLIDVVRRLLTPIQAEDPKRSDEGKSWPTAQNKNKESPISLAAREGHEEIVVTFLQYLNGSKVQDTGGWTVLHWAAYYGDVEVVQRLLTNNIKATITTLDHKGRTAADLARDLDLQHDPNRLTEPEKRATMLEWLRYPPAQPIDPPPPELKMPVQPSGEMETVCNEVTPSIMDFYKREERLFSLERASFSVGDVIYVLGPEAIMSSAAKRQNPPLEPEHLLLRWIHLPANNITWAKDLMRTIAFCGHGDAEEHSRLSTFVDESWNEHLGAPHARFMKPDFRFHEDATTEVTESKSSRRDSHLAEKGQDEKKPEKEGEDDAKVDILAPGKERPKIDGLGNTSPGETGHVEGTKIRSVQARNKVALYIPYLTFDNLHGLSKLQGAIKEAQARSGPDLSTGKRQPSHTERDSTRRDDFNKEGNKSLKDDPNKKENPDQWHKLVRAYLNPEAGEEERGLHVPRTLDQFYYHSLSNTSTRDNDQVIYRYQTRYAKQDDPENYMICMVNQLWLWIIDEKTIITCFPPRWGGESHGVLQSIKHHLLHEKRPPLSSVYQMATLITSICMNYALRTRPDICKERLLHMFGASIGEVTSKEVDFFKNFREDIEKEVSKVSGSDSAKGKKDASDSEAASAGKQGEGKKDDDKEERKRKKKEEREEKKRSNNEEKKERKEKTTGEEKDNEKKKHNDKQDKKRESRDIKDEIDLLREVKDIRDELNIIKIVLEEQEAVSRRLFGLTAGIGVAAEPKEFSKDRFVGYYYVQSGLDSSTREVAKMIEDARNTYGSINHLLDLRQKQANLSEAVWTRQQSEDTTKQGRTIMVFTIVTIIFLPMSFFSSLLALNITDFPHNSGSLSYTSHWAYSRIFGYTAAISVPLIIIAWFVNQLMEIFERFFFDWHSLVPNVSSSFLKNLFVQKRQQAFPPSPKTLNGLNGRGRETEPDSESTSPFANSRRAPSKLSRTSLGPRKETDVTIDSLQSPRKGDEEMGLELGVVETFGTGGNEKLSPVSQSISWQ